MTSVEVKSGATVCASSNDAHVTADQREVVFDHPAHGTGWNILTRAVGRSTLFTVSVTEGTGVHAVHWSNQFKCIRADDQQCHMSRP